jgi:hypothetical protein
MTEKTYKEFVSTWIADEERTLGDCTYFYFKDTVPNDKVFRIEKFGFYVSFSNPELYRDFFDSVISFNIGDTMNNIPIFQIPASDIAAPEHWPGNKSTFPHYMEAWIEPTRRIAIHSRRNFFTTIESTKRFAKLANKIKEDPHTYAEIRLTLAGHLFDSRL